MKKFKELREGQESVDEAYKQVEVDWDQDRPDRELAGDIKADFGVYIDGYSKKKGTLKVTGSEKELMNWITDTDELGLGFDKKTAQGIIKKGKNVKESVDEAKKLGGRVKITKGRFAGKEGVIRQMDNGKFKGADKSFDIDLDDGKEANGVPGKDIKIVKEALGNDNASHRQKPKIDKDGTIHNIPGKKGGLVAYNIKPRLDGSTLKFGTVDNEGNIKVMTVQELAKALK